MVAASLRDTTLRHTKLRAQTTRVASRRVIALVVWRESVRAARARDAGEHRTASRRRGAAAAAPAHGGGGLRGGASGSFGLYVGELGLLEGTRRGYSRTGKSRSLLSQARRTCTRAMPANMTATWASTLGATHAVRASGTASVKARTCCSDAPGEVGLNTKRGGKRQAANNGQWHARNAGRRERVQACKLRRATAGGGRQARCQRMNATAETACVRTRACGRICC